MAQPNWETEEQLLLAEGGVRTDIYLVVRDASTSLTERSIVAMLRQKWSEHQVRAPLAALAVEASNGHRRVSGAGLLVRELHQGVAYYRPRLHRSVPA